MKKVYFVYRMTDAPYGGINSFNRALFKAMAQNPNEGFEPAVHPKEADLIFLSAASRGPDRRGRDGFLKSWQLDNLRYGRSDWHPAGWFRIAGDRDRPVVHRLDGLTSRYGRLDGKPYDDLQMALNTQARVTIFQSRFCRDSFRTNAADRATDRIILNGVDDDFFPAIQRAAPGKTIRLIASSWSSNPHKGHAACAELSRQPNVHISFFGRWPSNLDRQNVQLIAPRPQNQMADVYRQADAFVHMALQDPCPNVVTEALATGLPLLYLHSGGTPEIAKGERYGVSVLTTDSSALANGVERLRERWTQLHDTILADRDRFLMKTVYHSYTEGFRQALNR